MDIIVTSVVPLFSVIFIGFFAGKIGVIDQAGIRTLVKFVFSLAMPALLFRMMANAEIGATDDWPVLIAYFAAQLPVFIAGFAIGGILLRQSLAEMTIQAFGSGFSNALVLGLPLALSLYGERAAVPALLLLMLDIIVFSATTLLLEIAALRDKVDAPPHPLLMVRDLGLSVLSNPLILATLLGIAFAMSTLALPPVADKTLAFIGQAGPPAGLFALGATLSHRGVGGGLKPVTAMILVKLVLHPLLAWLVIFRLFDFDPIASSVALLFAACPVGANVYVFAARYEAATQTSATAILISTGLSMLSLSGLAILLSSNLT